MNHDELKTYSMVLLSNNLNTVFNEKKFEKSALPSKLVDDLQNGSYEKLLDFAL